MAQLAAPAGTKSSLPARLPKPRSLATVKVTRRQTNVNEGLKANAVFKALFQHFQPFSKTSTNTSVLQWHLVAVVWTAVLSSHNSKGYRD